MNMSRKIDPQLALAEQKARNKEPQSLFRAGLLACFLLTACGAPAPVIEVTVPKTEIQETKPVDNQTSAPSDNQSQSDNQTQISDNSSTLSGEAQNDNASDLVGDIIWQLEQADKSQSTQEEDKEPPSFEDLIPTGPDPSLADEALDAAFAMLRQPEAEVASSVFARAAKQQDEMRIGVFLPLSGGQAALGAQIDKGLQMAYFQIAKPQIELIYFDTAASSDLKALSQEAIAAEIDIAVGPLFSDKAEQILPFLRMANIPILSFSNNQKIAANGLWVMGLLPEQQMDILLGQALSQGYQDIAILADQSLFGQRMSQHIINRLTAFGMRASAYQPIDGNAASDDEMLISQIKNFARYVPLEDGELISDRPAPYEVVILAGGADFILKVAPLLSYYDLGPDRVAYLGTNLWANPALTGEPSLQDSYLAAISPELSAAFSDRHQGLFDSPSSYLGQLGFDVMAVAVQALTERQNETDKLQDPLIASILREQGFKGYTGSFKLAANGLNYRDYIIYQLVQGELVPTDLPPAPPIQPAILAE